MLSNSFKAVVVLFLGLFVLCCIQLDPVDGYRCTEELQPNTKQILDNCDFCIFAEHKLPNQPKREIRLCGLKTDRTSEDLAKDYYQAAKTDQVKYFHAVKQYANRLCEYLCDNHHNVCEMENPAMEMKCCHGDLCADRYD